MTKANNKIPKRIVLVGVSLRQGNPVETEEPVPAIAPPVGSPKSAPTAGGKKKVWTSPTLKESSLQVDMKKMAQRALELMATIPLEAVANGLELETVEGMTSEPVEVMTSPEETEDEWPAFRTQPTPVCSDPDCKICTARRRHQLALLNAQVILHDAYRRARN